MIFHKGQVKIAGICNGAVCGLAAITPAAGYVQPGYACLCGFTSAILSYFFIKIKVWFMDDSLDVVAIHMLQGIYGTLFTGIFASKVVSSTGLFVGSGWVDGNFIQLPIQLCGVVFTFLWSFVITAILFVILAIIPGLGWRVTPHEERIGLDQSEHGDDSYLYEDLEDLNYIGNEKKQEDFMTITKALYKDYLIPAEKRPPKKMFTRDNKKNESNVEVIDNNQKSTNIELKTAKIESFVKEDTTPIQNPTDLKIEINSEHIDVHSQHFDEKTHNDKTIDI